MLKQKEILDLRKKEMLHKKWSERVQEPIRTQIRTEMKGPVYPELDRWKRELHKEYLEHVNKKVPLFITSLIKACASVILYIMHVICIVFMHDDDDNDDDDIDDNDDDNDDDIDDNDDDDDIGEIDDKDDANNDDDDNDDDDDDDFSDDDGDS